jgi:hypothetical protein
MNLAPEIITLALSAVAVKIAQARQALAQDAAPQAA